MKENEKLDTLEGTVEHIIYSNEQTGYAVVNLAVSDEELVTIVGTLPYITEGETVVAHGSFITHPKFGHQFAVTYYEKKLPETESAILKYLSSRTVKGIGPTTAKKIVDAFGIDTFDVIENHPDMLDTINGITSAKAHQISEEFKKQHGVRNVIMFCRDFFGTSASVKIYKKWGSGAVDLIKQNPYMLCDAEMGIGFDRADKAARSMGLPKNSSERIKAGIKYILLHNARQNGHTFLPEDKLMPTARELLGTDIDETDEALEGLILSGEVIKVKNGSRSKIFLKEYYEAEQYVCKKMFLLDEHSFPVGHENVRRAIDIIELSENIKYAPMQREAIRLALDCGVMILTGGPGTGKSATRFCVN